MKKSFDIKPCVVSNRGGSLRPLGYLEASFNHTIFKIRWMVKLQHYFLLFPIGTTFSSHAKDLVWFLRKFYLYFRTRSRWPRWEWLKPFWTRSSAIRTLTAAMSTLSQKFSTIRGRLHQGSRRNWSGDHPSYSESLKRCKTSWSRRQTLTRH